MVPNGWNKTYLKNIISGSIKNGYSPLPAANKTGYWVMSLGALTDNGINAKEIKPVDLDEKVKQSLLTNGDFLISRSNTPDKVGRSIRFKGEIENCSYPDLMMKFRVDPERADPDFVEFKLSSSEIRQYYKSCAAGSSSTMVKINKLTVENTPLLLPSLSEQRKIAQILSSWDKAITTTEQLLANSQQQKKALMQQLLTGKKRLLDKNGVRFSGEFKRYHFSDLLEIDRKSLGSKTKPNLEFDYISLSDVGMGTISGTLERHIFNTSPSRARRIVSPGDILLATVRPNLQGFAKIKEQHKHCIASTGFAVLTPKKGTCGDFVYHYLFGSHTTGQINALVVGTNYPAINSSDVSGLCIYCPHYEEQVEIAKALNNSDELIHTLQRKLKALKQEKKALMQQLLTGKRRVLVS